MDEIELRMWAMELAAEAGAAPEMVLYHADLYLAYLFPEPQPDVTGASKIQAA